MRQIDVSRDEVLAGFDALADIYGHVPPLIMWRAWEYAIYRRYSLAAPILDIGCGDGRFFRRVFPDALEVIGIDESPVAVDLARQSGVYQSVHQTAAHDLSLPDGSVASAFANCSIEHMSHVDQVLEQIHRALRPDGVFLLSVVTDTFVSWAPLRAILEACGVPGRGSVLQANHEAYHHLVNAFSRDEWLTRLRRAGFRVREWSPIVWGPAGWVFLLLDQYWHLERGTDEWGSVLGEHLRQIPGHAAGLRKMFEGLLDLSEAHDREYAGVVFLAER